MVGKLEGVGGEFGELHGGLEVAGEGALKERVK